MSRKLAVTNGEESMTVAVTQCTTIKNQILARLPREKYHHLFSSLRPVRLNENEVLYNLEDDFHYAYFINSGVVSLLSIMKDGSSIEVGNVGNEGIVGISVVLGEAKASYQIIAQVSGEALAVNAAVLRHEFDKEGELRDWLLRYTHAFSTYMSQLGVCSYFHTLDKRLGRFLLTTSDRVRSDSFHLTHEFLSQVLGSGRTGVTMAAIRLQRAGLISYHRGHLTILNRAGLEAVTCDCYQIAREVFDHLRCPKFAANGATARVERPSCRSQS